MTTQFGTWLGVELEQRDISKRALARRLAEKHPRGASADVIENYRRTIHKYLSEGTSPTLPMRNAIADALGMPRDAVPSPDDADEESRDVAAALQALAREQAQLSRRLQRVLKAATS